MSLKSKKDSPAITLLAWVYAQTGQEATSSWSRLNSAMHEALRLVVGAGFRFEDGDFEAICDRFNSGHWIGSSWEWVYSAAIAENNASAFEQFEAWKKRQPIIANNVTPVQCRYVHMSSERDRCRLHVGARFKWKGVMVTVTSFDDDGNAVACSYKDAEQRKVGKRFRISREDVIEDRADREYVKKVVKAIEPYRSERKRLCDEFLAKARKISRDGNGSDIPRAKLKPLFEAFLDTVGAAEWK